MYIDNWYSDSACLLLKGLVEKTVRESFKHFYTIDNFWFSIKKND